jgi:acylphosphatase
LDTLFSLIIYVIENAKNNLLKIIRFCFLQGVTAFNDHGGYMAQTLIHAVHMIAFGRVQGVGFRFFVRDKATRHGIKGWVRNRPDGSVEIHAESRKELLDEFIAAVKEGPILGLVSDVEVEQVEPTNKYTNFNIEF